MQAGLAALFFIIGFFSIPAKYHVDPAAIPLTELSSTNPGTRSTHTVFLVLADNRRVDWIGTVLSVSGLVLLTFALSDASSSPRGWKTPWLPPLIPISVALLVAFFWWENRLGRKLAEHYAPPNADIATNVAATGSEADSIRSATSDKPTIKKKDLPPPPPLISPALWRAPHLPSLLAIVFFAWAAFNTSTFYLNLLLQLVLEVTPIKAALYFLPMIASGFVMNLVPGTYLEPMGQVC